MIDLLFMTHYTGLGGGETALLTLAQHLDPARFRPHLLVPRAGKLAERWRGQGWPVHIRPWRGATVYFVPSLWAQFPIARDVEQLVKAHDIRAIHSDYHSLPMALPAGERAGIPVVWTCWGWWFRPRVWQRDFFRRPAATFAPSQVVKDGFLGTPPFMEPSRVRLLYPGVDTARFHPGVDGQRLRAEAGIAPDAPVVALLAHFQRVKGHEVFQAMARELALQLPQVRLLVAGDNAHGAATDEAYKQQILRSWRADPLLRDHVVYLGFREDTHEVLAAADVVVCTSTFESFGMVIAEAMASGKPVVSTCRGGPSETILHGQTGFLIEPGNAASFAGHVAALLTDPVLRADLGAAGRARAEQRYSAQTMADEFVGVLGRVMAF